ncbi:MAG: PEGA domain-containing protein [Rariglobus sp.]
MKLRFLVPALLAGCVLIFSSGCAVMSKGRSQMVVVRSTPEGATGLINGIEVGQTPFKIELNRSSAYTIELRKAGFENAAAVILPVANEYEKRFFRWGIDYELGAMTDLTPEDLVVDLKPVMSTASTSGDRFQEMTYRVLQADALLAAKEISPADHKYMVDQIVKFYTN